MLFSNLKLQHITGQYEVEYLGQYALAAVKKKCLCWRDGFTKNSIFKLPTFKKKNSLSS